MRVKLDENLGRSVRLAFEAAGHDTSTVRLQGLAGASDRRLFDTCVAEERVLVTLDVDFSNPLEFDPRAGAGVAVLRLSHSPSPSELSAAVAVLLAALARRSIAGSLWVVRGSGIRRWSPPYEVD